ncbi:hypothetical protein ACHAXR_002721 [Thalassiosira sp. AJA248-18]
MSAATATPSTASKPLKLTSTSQTLPHGHLDYVLDMAFDYYGRRFATASGDRTVRVWDLNSDGLWASSSLGSGGGNTNSSHTNEWQAHRGAVHRISWAHPEFGQLLATAGADHSVVIWEEREGGFKSLATPERSADGFLDTNNTTNTGSAGGTGEGASRWVNKATLSDARRAVTSVEFAPRHLGLRLASGSADGVVRIYEALDTMNLNHWKLEAEIEEDNQDGNQGHQRMSSNHVQDISSNENMGVSSLSWCAGRFEPATLVVGFSSGRVSIYRYNDGKRSWLEAIRLPSHTTSNGVPRGVLDVAWAPNVGRSYHLIATCGKDNQLKVHRVKRGRGVKQGDADNSGGGSQSSLVYEGTEVLDQSQAWRCQWNVTGTVLASSGDGGMVKLWKSDFQGRWKCVSEIVGDTTGVAAATAAFHK